MLRALLMCLVATASAGAQAATGGTINGTVVDEDGAPVRDAEVRAAPSSIHGRTDSTGAFTLSGLDAGFYEVRVRRIGFLSGRISTDLAKGGRVDLKFQLKRRPAFLDSVVVRADGNCPELTFVGFLCRRQRGGGLFLTDDDILDRGAVELGDIFRDLPGFRIENVRTQFGVQPAPIPTHGSQCLNAIVNGRALARANPLPRTAQELLGVEIYEDFDKVPPEYRRLNWTNSIRQSQSRSSAGNRCALAVYWTRYN